MQRVVVDTNVWVSAALNPSGHPAQVLTALATRRFTLLVSQPMLAELREVLLRPRLTRKYHLTEAAVDEFVALLRERAQEVSVDGSVKICRDPDDDVIIETALRGRAEVLVTRDDDMKGAAEVIEVLAEAGVAVRTVQRFLDALTGASTTFDDD